MGRAHPATRPVSAATPKAMHQGRQRRGRGARKQAIRKTPEKGRRHTLRHRSMPSLSLPWRRSASPDQPESAPEVQSPSNDRRADARADHATRPLRVSSTCSPAPASLSAWAMPSTDAATGTPTGPTPIDARDFAERELDLVIGFTSWVAKRSAISTPGHTLTLTTWRMIPLLRLRCSAALLTSPGFGSLRQHMRSARAGPHP